MSTEKDIAYVASLSKLRLTSDAAKTYVPDMTRILDYVAALNEVPTDTCDPTAYVLTSSTSTRPDQPAPSLTNDEALAAAPESHDGCFCVPRVI